MIGSPNKFLNVSLTGFFDFSFDDTSGVADDDVLAVDDDVLELDLSCDDDDVDFDLLLLDE